MHDEIERKFLVHAERLPPLGEPYHVTAAYLSLSPVVRVTLGRGQGYPLRAVLAIKAPGNPGAGRLEFPYVIPLAEGMRLLGLRLGWLVTKRRYDLPAGDGLKWEIDFFTGPNAGLVMAEIELPHRDTPLPGLPEWIKGEVTDLPAFQNQNLAIAPYKLW